VIIRPGGMLDNNSDDRHVKSIITIVFNNSVH
jgi:hypothetical protein